MISRLQKRIAIWSIGATLSCLFVCGYNQFGLWQMESERAVLITVMLVYIKLQWFGFVAPLVGILAGCRARGAGGNSCHQLVPDLLSIFTVSWCLVCILMWKLQAARMFPE